MSDKVNPQQLAILYPARDLVDDTKFRAADYSASLDGRPEQMWERKLTETEEGYRDLTPGALARSVKEDGILSPVRLIHPGEDGTHPAGRPTIDDGHHRIAVANDIDPTTEVPVHWKKKLRFDAR